MDARPTARTGTGLATALVLGTATVLLASRALTRPLIHDEHQFVVPGALLAREGLLPYLDYPYFHVPYLPFVNALVAGLTDHLLLGARLVSVAASGMLLALLHRAARRRTPTPWAGTVAGAAVVVLVLASPAVFQAAGLSWNHETATAASLAAVLALASGLAPGAPHRRLVAAGFLLSLAVGLRLSAAPLGAPFLLAAALARSDDRRDRPSRRLLALGLGGILGALPMLVLAAMAPEAFWFGNFGYPALNTAAYATQSFASPMTLAEKAAFFVDQVALRPGHLALAAVALLGSFSGAMRRGLAARGEAALGPLILLCLPFVLAGSFAATPSQPQYFMPLVPFAAALAVAGLEGTAGPAATVRAGTLVVAATVAAATGGAAWIDDVRAFADRSRWEAVAVHEVGEEIAAQVGDGPVFTLSPLYPVEGGVPIYPCLATGPFTWRVGPLMEADERRAHGFHVGEEFQELLEARPPAGVLTGAKGGLAHPLGRWSRRHPTRRLQVSNGMTLYVFDEPAGPDG